MIVQALVLIKIVKKVVLIQTKIVKKAVLIKIVKKVEAQRNLQKRVALQKVGVTNQLTTQLIKINHLE